MRRSMPMLLFLMIGIVSVTAQAAFAKDVLRPVWVANENGDSISVIDTHTNKVIKTIAGIMGPHNVQAAPDGKTIWATSHANQVVVIDAATYKILRRIPVGREPVHVVLIPDGTSAYVTNEEDGTVSVIDTSRMKVRTTIQAGKGPHGLRPSPNGKEIYVANSKGTTLSVIEVPTDKKAADIEVGKGPVQVGFSPDGTFVYFSLNGENAAGKVDAATRKMVGKVSVGRGPIQVFVTPDNKSLLVANQGTEGNPDNTVSMIDTSTFSIADTIKTNKGAHGVAIDDKGTFAYVTNTFANTVSVINILKRRVAAEVAVGKNPNGVSVSPTRK